MGAHTGLERGKSFETVRGPSKAMDVFVRMMIKRTRKKRKTGARFTELFRAS
jgi:hypothetical protein